MPKKPVKRKPYKRKSILYSVQDEELKKRLVLTISGIVLFSVILITSLILFAPKIGGFFAILSANRNEINVIPDVAPIPPVFSELPSATSRGTIIINGLAEPGATIKLYLNGPLVDTTTASNDGMFTFANVQLIKGRNTFFAKAVNEKGQESAASERVTVVFDDEPPVLTISEPEDEEVIENWDRRILVRGSVDKRSTVRVNDQLVVVRPDLTFEFLLGVSDGEHEIVVTATDEAGNTTTQRMTVTYVWPDR
jgi:hypothetical protein